MRFSQDVVLMTGGAQGIGQRTDLLLSAAFEADMRTAGNSTWGEL